MIKVMNILWLAETNTNYKREHYMPAFVSEQIDTNEKKKQSLTQMVEPKNGHQLWRGNMSEEKGAQ